MTSARRRPGVDSPGARRSLDSVNYITRVDEIRDRLTARATVASYRIFGPIQPAELEAASRELDHEAADLLRRGLDVEAVLASNFADRLVDAVEVLRLRRAPWSGAPVADMLRGVA